MNNNISKSKECKQIDSKYDKIIERKYYGDVTICLQLGKRWKNFGRENKEETTGSGSLGITLKKSEKREACLYGGIRAFGTWVGEAVYHLFGI